MAAAGPSRTLAALSWAGGHAAGQNIAMAPTATDAFQAMLNSPQHRAQHARSRLAATSGVGAARDCAGQIYFTVNFLAAD